MSNPYKILGVSTFANKKEIKNAYRKLVIKYHPDVNPNLDAEKKFKEIVDAYKSTYKYASKEIGNQKDNINQTNNLYSNDIENVFKDFDSAFWKRVKRYKQSFGKIFFLFYVFEIVLKFLIFTSLALLISAFFWKDILPSLKNIDQLTKNPPIATETYLNNFEFNFKGVSYIGVPVGKISIYGLVVNKNTLSIKSNTDIYKKNIWLLFGDGFLNEDFKDIKIVANGVSIEQDSKFNLDNIIKAEIFTDNNALIEKLDTIDRNDQIRLSGWLFDYHVKGKPEWRVFTSKTPGKLRNQMIYLEDLSLIKKSSYLPLLIIDINKYLLPILILLKIIIWFIVGHLEWIYYKKIFEQNKKLA